MPTPPGQLAKWERIRGRGAVAFVLVYGVLAWGGLFGLLFPLVFTAAMGQLDRIGRAYALTIPLALIGGVVWGSAMWFVAERKYQALKLQTQDPTPPGTD